MRPVRTRGGCRSHHRHAVLRHQCFYVGKIHVDHAIDVDHFGNAGHRTLQYTIRRAIGIDQRGVFTQHRHQFFIRHDNQRIDKFGQRLNARLRQLHALAFMFKRLGHHRDHQYAKFLGHLRHHWGCTGTGTSTHACGNKHHIHTHQDFGNTLAVFECGCMADFRLGTGAQTLGQGLAYLQLGNRLIAPERLRIGVDRNKLHALHFLLDHMVDCIAAATTHTNDLNQSTLYLRIHYFKHN